MSPNRFSLLLSASVPSTSRADKYNRVPDAQLFIEEALISLARVVFYQGGQLIFGGHPSISPLIAIVASEFAEEQKAESSTTLPQPARVRVFQSRAYEDVLPQETIGLYTSGLAEIIWTPAVEGERYDPTLDNQPQCVQSLRLLREKMFAESPAALVCMGGMEGVEEEFALFLERKTNEKKIFLLPDTGGATALLAERHSNTQGIEIMREDPPPAEVLNLGKQEKLMHLLYPSNFLAYRIVASILGEDNLY
ncbi:hypothetical protein HRG84_13480 [Flavisolibacter sp. BT320]|nr:hypothetical protein [Flavisolibacter longurius]